MSVGLNESNAPSESRAHDEVALLVHELTIANRILLFHQIVDAFGHVSARHPVHPDRFLMARRIAPGLVREADIREFGLDGELIVEDGTATFLERFIHSAIYADRPDVNGVVHSHSPGIVSFSVVRGQPLRPVCHTAGFLLGEVPVFDMRDVAGPATDLMIRNQSHGHALSAVLGQGRVVLMRGHGSTVVGHSLQQAVYNAVYTETNARIQASALGLGAVTYLSPGEAKATDEVASVAVKRNWDFWKHQINRLYQ